MFPGYLFPFCKAGFRTKQLLSRRNLFVVLLHCCNVCPRRTTADFSDMPLSPAAVQKHRSVIVLPVLPAFLLQKRSASDSSPPAWFRFAACTERAAESKRCSVRSHRKPDAAVPEFSGFSHRNSARYFFRLLHRQTEFFSLGNPFFCTSAIVCFPSVKSRPIPSKSSAVISE